MIILLTLPIFHFIYFQKKKECHNLYNEVYSKPIHIYLLSKLSEKNIWHFNFSNTYMVCAIPQMPSIQAILYKWKSVLTKEGRKQLKSRTPWLNPNSWVRVYKKQASKLWAMKSPCLYPRLRYWWWPLMQPEQWLFIGNKHLIRPQRWRTVVPHITKSAVMDKIS